MNAREATDLLTIIASAEGRSEVNEAQAISWAFALDDVPVEIAKHALQDAFRAGDTYRLNPQTIRKHAAPYLRRLAANVRSAKLRRLIPQDWPDTRPLPPAAAERLRLEFDATNDREEIASQAAPRPKEIDR
jgi:hypothetical protein